LDYLKDCLKRIGKEYIDINDQIYDTQRDLIKSMEKILIPGLKRMKQKKLEKALEKKFNVELKKYELLTNQPNDKTIISEISDAHNKTAF
jgi:hypothetical protein